MRTTLPYVPRLLGRRPERGNPATRTAPRPTRAAYRVAAVMTLGLLAAPSGSQAAFCSCGYTSAEVKAWSDRWMAPPAGQARLDAADAALVRANPPAAAPFIDRATAVVKKQARTVAGRTLAWFKEGYKKPPANKPGRRALRRCLIAAYSTYLAERVAGAPKKAALHDAAVACISAAITSMAGEEVTSVPTVEPARAGLRAGDLLRGTRDRARVQALLAAPA